MSFKNDAMRGQKRSLAVVCWVDDWMVKKFPISFESNLKKKIRKTAVS